MNEVASPLAEIVPNFSDGRRADVMDAIVEALCVPGVRLVYRQADVDHNRLDTTLVGPLEALQRSASAGAAKAAVLIDMTKHSGGHPRMGAADVIPFVPVRGVTIQECVVAARETARDIGERLGIPVYLYGEAALTKERRSLADVRRGEYEGLKAAVAAGERLPDFGPHEIGGAGATAVGARKPLIAFNMYLTGSEEAAKEVARSVRESTGGLKCVRAIGFAVPDRGCVTVSMNLVDFEMTGMVEVFDAVAAEGKKRGMTVLDGEIVGLVPGAALPPDPELRLKLRGFDPHAVVLEEAVEAEGPS